MGIEEEDVLRLMHQSRFLLFFFMVVWRPMKRRKKKSLASCVRRHDRQAGLEAGTREKEVGDGGQDLTLTACLHFSSPSHSHRPSMSDVAHDGDGRLFSFSSFFKGKKDEKEGKVIAWAQCGASKTFPIDSSVTPTKGKKGKNVCWRHIDESIPGDLPLVIARPALWPGHEGR